MKPGLAALVVVVVAAAATSWWFLIRDQSDAGLPSADADRIALGEAVIAAGSANALAPIATQSAAIADLDLVEQRGSCDGAPRVPPQDRAGVVQAFAPSDPLSVLPVSAALGAFSFVDEQEARGFVAALADNLAVCAPGAVAESVAPASEPGASAWQVGVPFARVEVPMRFVVASRGRFAVVAAGVDAGQIDAVFAAVLADVAADEPQGGS